MEITFNEINNPFSDMLFLQFIANCQAAYFSGWIAFKTFFVDKTMLSETVEGRFVAEVSQ